jgi:hypothetical protein
MCLKGTNVTTIASRRFYICEALSNQPVALEPVGATILVRFRQMYLRELNVTEGTAKAFIQPVSQVSPMS